MPNVKAGEGQVFVCGACGKRSRDKYGNDPINRGWDVSCVVNSVLCLESHVHVDPETNRVTAVDDGGVVEEEKEETGE